MGNFPIENGVPSLALICLQMILSSCVDIQEFPDEIVRFIPAHLRRDLIRHFAVHSPLPTRKLYALLGPDGHADGEILIIGQSASLGRDHLQRMSLHNHSLALDWEADSDVQPLNTLVFLSSSLANSMLLAIPPTLTILGLIDVSSPQPLYRLPKLCPLLVLLDLSHNSWLTDPSAESYGNFEKIDWLLWRRLELLGLRGCYVGPEMLQRVEGLNVML